ncbi:hypothetical protein TNCV_4080491 [Trichonephila clavipes]|nr:hypothetical protein TNCV_4080491 [Trichonephila clavipes]
MSNYAKCPLYPKPKTGSTNNNAYTNVINSIVRPNVSYANAAQNQKAIYSKFKNNQQIAARSNGISAVASQTQAKKSTINPPQNNVVNNNQNSNANLINQSLQGIISALIAVTVQNNNINFNPNPPQEKLIKNKQTKKREFYALVEVIMDNDYE